MLAKGQVRAGAGPTTWRRSGPSSTRCLASRSDRKAAGRSSPATSQRNGTRSGVAKEALKLRAELVERSFALILDRGGMRRSWLRGRENLHKRYLVHIAGYNLGLIMRLLVRAGTPRELSARASAHLLVVSAADTITAILTVAIRRQAAMLVLSVETEPRD